MATFFRLMISVAVLAIACERLGVSLERFAVADSVDSLEKPGFENAEAWEEAVKSVIEKDDTKMMARILAIGESRLDGMYSTNYAHYLSRIAKENTPFFLRSADEKYGAKIERSLKYLVNESEGFPRDLRKSLEEVKAGSKEHAIAQRLLKLADAKSKRLGKPK